MSSSRHIYYYTIFLILSCISHCTALDGYGSEIIPFVEKPVNKDTVPGTKIKPASTDKLWSGCMWRNDTNWNTRISVCSGFELVENFSDNLLYKNYWFLFNYTGPIQIRFGFCLNFSKEKDCSQHFMIKKLSFRFGMKPNEAIRLSLSGGFGCPQFEIIRIIPITT